MSCFYPCASSVFKIVSSKRIAALSGVISFLSFLLVSFFPAESFGQVMVPFSARTTPANYKIKGDYAMMGNTNLTLVTYSNTNGNQNAMQYVDIDGVDSTFNSSSATLQFSTENSANPGCSNVLFAGLYWTGRTGDGSSSPLTFNVTKSVPTGTTTINNNYTIDHNEAIPNTTYTMTVSRGGSSGNYHAIYTFTNGTNTYVFNFTNNTGANRVTLSVNGGAAVNVPVTYTNAGNIGTATLTTPYVIVDGTVNITISQLIRDSRLDRTTAQTQTAGDATVNVSGTIPVYSNVTKTFDKRQISIKGPGATRYTEYTALPGDIFFPTVANNAANAFGMYAGFVDITSYVKDSVTSTVGEYFVADIALVEGTSGGATGLYGGWGMVVVYENFLMGWRDVTVFDGHAYVPSGVAAFEIPISGFETTPAGPVNLKVGVMAGEGDVQYTGDYFSIRNAANSAWVDLSHSGNTTGNYFNSSIVTGGNPRNPTLQNNTGLDISSFNVPNAGNTVMANGQTSTRFRYGTTLDTYIIFCIAMSSDSYVPEVEGLISVTGLNGSGTIPSPLTVGPGDEIEYTVDIRNIGTEAVNGHVITIPIPYTAEYVAGSLSSSIFFAPPPTPNNLYFDPNAGPTGSIIWDFGTLPLPADPSDLLASLTFTLRVIDNCILLNEQSCADALVAIGSLAGTGAITAVGITNSSLITGYETSGACSGAPITDPLTAQIVVPANYVNDNCTPAELETDFFFCGTPPTVAAVDDNFPTGTRFFNEFPRTVSSIEYTTTFPAVPGTTTTYYAIPSVLDEECAVPITISICGVIDAVNDLYGNLNCSAGGTNVMNVLSNDLLDGVAPNASEVTLTIITPDPTGNVTINANGSVDIDPGTPAGTYTVTYQICENGFPANCDQATLTVQDNVAPTAICQNITVALVNGTITITGAQVNNGSTDNCGIVSMSVTPNTFTCSNVGANSVTLTVTDASGNSSTCNATVTVTATAPPVAICQNISVNLSAGGTASITAAQINNGSTSACGIASMSVSPNTFTCANVGANTVTLTVTDVNGNSATCNATVTVVDVTPPTAVCQNLTVNLSAGGTATITSAQINNGSSDACGIASLSVSPTSFTCANVGANTVILTVTDVNGNSSTCNATVTVNDVTPPTAVCQNISVNLNSSGNATITAAQVNNGSSDACGIATLSVSPSSFNCGNVGANTVTLTVTDVNGNSSTCNATVTVNDVTPPTAVCTNITAQLNAAGAVTIAAGDVDNGSSDACGIATITVSPNTFTCANVGANTVTLTVTDVNGNTSTCTATVTVADQVAPTAVCQNISVNLNSSGTATITAAQINNGSSDNCGIASMSVSPSSFTCANVGANSVTLTVTDVNGNTATCAAVVTVNDVTQPTAICQNITVNLSAGGTASITAAQINNGSSDACGIASLSVSPSSFTCANIGANTVTLTVTDVNGNSSTCSATVTIVDVTPPTALCQNISVNLNSSGAATITAAQIDNGSSDVCGSITLSVSPSSFTCANVGANTVTLTVTDASGNSSTCTATVTVIDNTAPEAECQNISINLNAGGVATITAAQIDNGSSDACGIASLSVSPSSFDCSDIGANTVTLTVTDVNGNTATCTATVTVNDVTAPNTVCQNISVNLNAGGTASITAAQIDAASSDACGIASMSVSPSSFTCANIGANAVTLTVTDVNGNTSTCPATVTVNDVIPPTAVCQNITVNLNSSGTATITAAQINNGSSDNCGIASISVSPSSFTCVNVGANTVTLTVTDVNGNTSTCTATVTVVDNTAPTAVCQNLTVNLSAGGTASITAAQINNGSSDACGIASISVSPSLFTCANVGVNTVTLTVTDNNSNVSTCTATVTVVDITPPTAVCQNISVNLNSSGTATITAAQINNGSSDVCGVASLSVSPSSFNCSNIGANTVTLTVTDVNGNTSTCTATVTINDVTPPTAVCQNLTVNLNSSGTASITAAQVNNGSSDACGIASISVSPSSFNCSNIGANTVTLTVTDVNGNTSTCTATVTVVDNIAPTAVCQNITVDLNAGGTVSITASQVNNGSSDNCSIASLSVSPSTFTCSNIGANTVTLTVTDGSGNTSTCTATVTVQDNVAPTAICQNITVQLNAAGNVFITAAQINNGSFDNCGIASMSVAPSSFTCAGVGANPVELTVTDVNGNVSTCNATVTVQDNIAPMAICQNISVNLNSSGTVTIAASQVDNGSSDACGIASLSVSPNTFTCANIGGNTVTLTVTDVNGNTSTCTATVTVNDATPPTAICQNVTVQLNAAGTVSVTAAQINNGSSDACGIASLSAIPNTFTCANTGNNNVTLTVTDVNGNISTCTAVVTVQDIIAPTAICQNITVQLNAAGNASITAAQINNGSFDNCGIASLSVSPNSFTCANVGANTVTLTVTDVNGNTSTCTATVTVQDNVAPIAVCQNISVQLDATGNASITAAQINNGSSDNCGIASLSVSPSNFTCANVGANTVTLTVTDVNGNISTCTATVTIQDNVNPTAVCQNITIQLNAAGTASITAAQINNGSSDNCGIASLSVSPSSFTCTNVGANIVILTVADVNGNSSTCSATVTVQDVTPPVAVCQNITVQLLPNGTASITAGDVDNGSSDECGIASMSVSPSSFSCSNVGANTVTLTVTDVNGNSSICTATATVVDQVAPIALCQNITISLNAAGTASITSAQINNGSSDNCGIASITVSPSSFTCANVGANNVVLTVTDVNGNVSTCSAVVTVQDVTAPVAVCQNITVALNAGGTVSITGAQVNNGSSDACGIASFSVSPSSFTCANIGANTVTLTVTDVNGNSSTCPATVTVTDVSAPTAVCQNISVNLNGAGSVSITAAQVDNGSSDVCGSVTLSVSPSTFTCANVGANTVTLTVTDQSGNTSTCTATVTVSDVTPPVAVCQNVTIQLDAAGNASVTAAQINNGSSDACGIALLSVSPSSFTCANVGANTVTLTVTDVNGNTSTCTATVAVQDNVSPTAVCQNITVQLNALGAATITAAQINNGSSDNCGIASLSVSPSSFTCANVGANTVTLTVTDVNGNSSTCSATVTIQDNVAPVAICQNIVTQLNAAGNASISAAQVNNGSSDACGIATLSVSPSTFTCANVGANTVTLTVTDVNGNSSTCTATVTVQDNVAPVAVCQNVTVQLNGAGVGSVTAAQINNGSSDACGIASMSVSPSTFNCNDVGANTVTLTVTDVNGNSSTCTATVTVENNVLPSVVCQDISVNLNAAGTVSINASQVNNGSSASCGLASLTVTPSTFNCLNVGANTVTLTAVDVNGNTSSCTATVTVNDVTAPVALCQNITAQLNASGNASITAAQVNNGSSDACGIASVSVSPSSFTCADVGANTVTLTVMDINGNSSTCTATVTVEDNVAPTALCQNISINLNAAGTASITAAQVDNGSSDNCAISSMTVSPSTFTCANIGANTVTLTVTDVNGNSSNCNATVTVADVTPPTAVCQNITAQLDATGNVTITAAQINNGSSDACGIASMSVSPSSFTCAGVGANPVTLTVTDNNGNSSTCTATVSVVDNVPPVALCQNISVDLDATGNISINASQVDNGSSDACGIASISVSPSSFTCTNVGTNTITLTVTDQNGNVSTCNSTVTVNDATAPVAACQNITVQLNASGNASITAAQINSGSSDACGIASMSVSPSSFNCTNVGNNTVTLTVTDVNGNSSTCSATVTIQDNVAPVANCQNITVQLNASGTATITAAQVNNGSSDACGIASMAVSPSSFSCVNVGANTVTLTVTDVNGNISTCTATVTVQDNVAPVALCQNITVNLDAAGNATITAAQINNNSSDACGIASLSVSPSSFNCGNVGANTVTLTVTDVNGNASTCTATVTVVDNTAPIALCQNITVNVNAGGTATITASQVNNGSSDACGIASMTVSPSSFTCANVGANTVTLSVTDFNGNTSTCTATVTVADITPPIALCQNVVVQLDAGGNASVTAAQVNNGSTDACGIATLSVSPSSFTCANVGANAVTLTVTDVNGNVSTCSATVTVQDNIDPVAICQNITAQLDATGNIIVTAAQINNGSVDNCGIASIVINGQSQLSYNCGNVGANTVTMTVTDVNGNVSTCTATITVVDNVAPNAICQNITAQLDATGNIIVTAAQINNGSNDNCGIASIVINGQSQLSFNCSNVGVNTVTLTVTDVNGNSSNCTATITVEDNIAPNALCQNITAQLDATGNIIVTAAQINNGSNDNCGIASITLDGNQSQLSFDCSDVGVNNVTLTVTDVNGNVSTCSATITVEDNIAPTAICQNITVQLDATGNAIVTAAQINNGSTDNCGIASILINGQSQISFGCLNVGANTVSLTVTDVNGNVSSCTATVTVLDNASTPPTAICQNITVQLDALGNASITAAQVDNGSFDNCGIASMSVSPNTFNCANVGANTVTLTVTDLNGNSATCTAIVTVEDNIAPNAICQNITAQLDATGNIIVTAAQVNNGSNDNCGISTITLDGNQSQLSFDCSHVGVNTVTLTVTDVNGNVSTCSATITIQDNASTPPTAICQNITVQLDATGNATITAAAVDGGSFDNCGIASLSVSQTTFDCGDIGANTVTLTVTDVNGNSSQCTATVTVEDNVAPVANCQNITVQLNAAGTATIAPGDVDNGSSDACGIASITVSPNTFTCANVGANTVTLTVIDVNGNVTTCTATATVQDNVPPIATCQNITVQLDASGNATLTAAQINNNSTDNCGIASMTVSVPSFTCANIGANNVTLTVTDVNGNSSSCVAVVTVQDNIAPTAVCQNISVQLNAGGSVTITAAQVNNGSSDACGIAAMSVTPSTFTCANVGANTVTLTVIDNNGNQSTCTATVTVLDNNAPTALCQNITVQLDATGNATITASQVDNGSGDQCGPVTLSVNPSTFDCSNIGANTVTLTVTDLSGNSTTCTATVTIQDNVDPVVICQNINVELDVNGQVVITAAQIDNGTTDNCSTTSSGLIFSLSETSFDCSNIGANTVTFTATDAYGNSSTCTATVNVSDTVSPVVVCQNITIDLDANGNAVITAAQVDNGSADACGIANMTVSPSTFDCSNIGVNTVTLTVTDNNGNSSSCDATVTIEDNSAPSVVCQNITVQLDANGNAVIVAADIDGGSTDNCSSGSGLTFSASQTAFDCSNIGVNTITLTVTDAFGNSSSCDATVTVSDTVSPVAICQSITVQLDATGQVDISAIDINGGSTDNCSDINSGLTFTASQTTFDCSDEGANIVTLTVTDAYGNSSTCTATVTVENNITPAVVCQDITVQLDATGNVIITAAQVDGGTNAACGIASLTVAPSSFDCSDVGANTVTLTATDNSGNVSTCTAIVTVQDTINPTVVCQNITVQLDANGNAVITGIDLDNGTTDNCSTSGSGLTYVASQTNFDCSNIGANTVTLTVTDANGNSSSCDAVVTITDTVSPTVICQNITVQLDANGNAVITAVDVDGGSSDNCSTPNNGLVYSISNTNFDCSNVGANTVSLTVTDAFGNSSSCSATVTIVDDVDPIAICQNITIQLDNNGQATITAAQVNNGSSDNCAIASMTVNPNTFTCSGIGANPVTLTVTDVNGNVSTCSSIVTIQDNIDPIAICRDITINLDGAGNTSIVPSQVDNGSSDACGIASMTVSPNTFDCSNVGANTVTLVVTDLNGNVDSCTSVVTVVDATAPDAICQNITVTLDSAGSVSITAAQIDNGSTDACGIDTMFVSTTSFNCTNIGDNLVTLTVVDVNGNSDNCFATITVTDVIAPVFTLCPTDITIQPDSSNCNPSVTWVVPVATDNCAVTSLVSNFQSGSSFPVGTTTVTYTAIDASGNTTICSFDINVLANPLLIAAVADTFNCAYNVSCAGGNNGSAIALPAGGCMPYSYLWSNGQTSQTATGLSATTYSVTVTDGLGNAATTSITLSEPSPLVVDSLTSPLNGGWNIGCANTNNGVITLAASGGADCVDYNYAWTGPNGYTSSNEDLQFVFAGTYYVTITDVNGCSTNDSITLTEPELLEVNLIDQVNVSCFGLADGSATVEAAGGANGYQYLWSDGQTTATADNLGAGVYFVSVTDNNGCIASTNVVIGEPNPLNPVISVVSNYNGQDVSCTGDADGVAQVLAFGGTPAYSYSWSNGGTEYFVTDLTAGTYFVTVTDANGCDSTVSVTLVDPPVLTADVVSIIEPSCNGVANGSATVQANGGTPGYYYYWSNTQEGETAIGLAAGTYIVSVFDTNGCNVFLNVIIDEPQSLEITSSNITVTNVSCNGGTDGAIDITPSGGTAPYSYSWSNGATTQDISGLIAGLYNITVSDSLGCDTTISIVVSEPATLVATISSSTQPSCSGVNNGTATIDVIGGTAPYTYLWIDGQTSATATNLAQGIYDVTVTDANGCTATTQVAIVDPVVLSVGVVVTSDFNGQDVSCFGAANGVATVTAVGGTAPYTYAWSNGQTGAVISNLFAGTYIVTATDANGCSSSDTLQLVNPPQLVVVISNTSSVSCAGQANGSATANVSGGTAPYTYSWTNGQTTQTATGLAFGIHQVTVVDANGCSQTVFADITEPPSLTASVIFILDVSCNGGSNGAGFIDVVGGTAPYTYLWSNGTTTEDLNGVGAGNYTVSITDASGCDTTLSLIIPQPTAMVANIINQVNVGCAGGATGEATISVSGGIPGYTYLWDNGQTTVTATGLTAGLHSVTIRDANNCITIVNFVITENAVMSAGNVQVTNVSCNGANNGSINFNIAGGNAPYTYVWSNGQTTVPATNLVAGDYSVTITDAQGCIMNLSFTVSQPAALDLQITNLVQPACGGSATGIATVGVTGGVTPYTFAWDNGQTTATAINLTTGVHTVVVTDANGCADSITVTITAPGNMSISLIGSSQPTCFGGANGTATILVTGGTAPYTYAWSPLGGTNSTATGLSAGIYTVIVSDANSCAASQTITITQPSQIVADINSLGNVVCAGDSVTISATATGGNGVYTYTWNNGLGNGASHIVLPSVPTTYIVTVTDGLGCTGIQDSVTVTISAPPVAAFTLPSSVYSCTYPVTVDFTNTSTNAVSYSWNFGNGTNATTTNGQASYDTTGTYMVVLTATSASGCVDTAVYIYNVYPAPTASFSLSGNSGCAPYTVTFTNNSVDGITYSWNFGDGSTSTLANPVHTYQIPGTYNVTLVVSGGGLCNDTLQLLSAVTVYQTPVADFTSDYYNITDPDGQIQFTNLSTGATTYSWNFGDGNTSTLENPINNYNDNGEFEVTLIAMSGAGCSDTITQTVEVELFKGLYMPNAMIVGGDGDFGLFLPKGVGIATYQCFIFDKWGNLLWQSTKLVDGKPVEGWDGRYNGVVVPQGAYIWKADATFMDGTTWEGMEYENGKFMNTGNVTVLE